MKKAPRTSSPSAISSLPPILSRRAMQEADRQTIESFGLPGNVLMETAGRAVAEKALRMLDGLADPSVLIVCGKGNNGGDGFVVGRVLLERGARVDVLMAADPETPSDARVQLDLLRRLGEHASGVPLRFVDAVTSDADLIVDALLGTGLSSDVRSPMDDLIDELNAAGIPILSVDIPSGLDSDSGRILGTAIRARATVTMGAWKMGLLLEDGPECTGDVDVAEIGIPGFVLQGLTAEPGCAHRSTDAFVSARMHPRARTDYKYSTGPTIVAGGSQGYAGAPVLAAIGAARVGSGYVTVYCPPDIRDLVGRKVTEIPVTAWTPDGVEHDLQERWTKGRALLVGPGMGRSDDTPMRVRTLLESFTGPAVVDADGLFALASAREWVHERAAGRWIFTPHDGEFARMNPPEADGSGSMSRVESARRFARAWNVVLLLKGQPSLIAEPDGRVVVNATGHPAAGTAGSGDVLGGMVAGLLAQGLDPFEAAVCAVHLGGRAAAACAAEGASQSTMATDILDALPRILSDYTDA